MAMLKEVFEHPTHCKTVREMSERAERKLVLDRVDKQRAVLARALAQEAPVLLLWGREAWQITNMMQEPVYLVSGFYFPVRSFGFAIAFVSYLLLRTASHQAKKDASLPFSTTPA